MKLDAETWLGLSHLAILLGVLLSAAGGYGSYFFTKKIDDKKEEEHVKKIDTLLDDNKKIKDQLNPFIETASKLFPRKSQEDALESLGEEFSKLKADFDKEINTIKSFEVELSVTFSGSWQPTPYPSSIFGGFENPHLVQICKIENGKLNEAILPIRLYCTKPYTFRTIDESTAKFKASLSARNGEIPIGSQANVIEDYNALIYMIPFLDFGKFNKDHIEIEKDEIQIFINGANSIPLIPHINDLPQKSEIVPLDEKSANTIRYATVLIYVDWKKIIKQ